MNDFLFAGVTLALIGGWLYLRRAIDSESASRGAAPEPRARFRRGLRWLLTGHLVNLGLGIPVFALLARTMYPA